MARDCRWTCHTAHDLLAPLVLLLEAIQPALRLDRFKHGKTPEGVEIAAVRQGLTDIRCMQDVGANHQVIVV